MIKKEVAPSRDKNRLNRRTLIASAVAGGTAIMAGCMGGSDESETPSEEPENADQTADTEAADTDADSGSDETDAETGSTDDQQSETSTEDLAAADLIVEAEKINGDLGGESTQSVPDDSAIEDAVDDAFILQMLPMEIYLQQRAYIFEDVETAKEKFDRAPGLTSQHTPVSVKNSGVGDEAILYHKDSANGPAIIEARRRNVIVGVYYDPKSDSDNGESQAKEIAEMMLNRI